MKKHLLLFAAAAMTSLSSFALEEGELVYAPQGKFQILSSENICTNGTFANTDGWQSLDATELGAFVAVNPGDANGLGVNSLQCNTFGAANGLYYKINPGVLDASKTYVVSFKVKAASTVAAPNEPVCTQICAGLNAEGFRVIGTDISTDGKYTTTDVPSKTAGNNPYLSLISNTGDTIASDADYLCAADAVMLTGEWQTVSYAIEGDGAARTWYFVLRGMPVGMEIADVQIQEAEKGFDDRKVGKTLEMAKAILNCYDWSKDYSKFPSLEEDIAGVQENIEIVENAGFSEDPTAIDDLNSVLDEFMAKYFENYFKSCKAGTYWPDEKVQRRQNTMAIGDWNLTVNGSRGICHYWNSREDQLPYIVFGNYGKGQAMTTSRVEMTKTLEPGVYVWALDGQRFSQMTGYVNNRAFDFGAMRLFIGDEQSDSIAIYARDYSQGTYVIANITETQTVSIGWESYNEGYDEFKGGGDFRFYNPMLMVKLTGEFNSDQIKYWQKVKEQVATGRTQLGLAAENLANADYIWGKAVLQACVDTVSPKIADFENLDSISVIRDTYVEGCADSAATSVNSQMIYTVYNAGVRDILAANRKIVAVNDTLNMLASAIEQAEIMLIDRLYSMSVNSQKLADEIAKAKNLQTEMLAADYTEDNANAIKEEIEALKTAKQDFADGVPAEIYSTLVDIDFANKAVAAEEGVNLDEVRANAVITGAQGAMTITNFTSGPDADNSSRQGVDVNGETVNGDALVLGVSEGFVPVDLGEVGSNIYSVSCDIWLGYLTNKTSEKVGFFLLDENDENVSGIYFNGDGNVDPAAEGYDPCGLREKGEFYAPDKSNNKNDVANHYQDAYKHHFVLYVDYGTKKAKLTCVSPKGEFISDWKTFSGEPFTQFKVMSGYDNAGRRCWFDNLKIEKITAAEVVSVVGDVNGDGKVTMADANAIVNYFLAEDKSTIDNFDVTAADVNGDGGITMADANSVVNIFLGVTVE